MILNFAKHHIKIVPKRTIYLLGQILKICDRLIYELRISFDFFLDYADKNVLLAQLSKEERQVS